MRKKKLALLMAAALTLTSADGTALIVNAADITVDATEGTADEFGDVEISTGRRNFGY